MERKIGEIFELGGEWYQCVESDSCGECSLFTTECGDGTKSYLADKVFGQCSKVRRSDNKHIVFKKLEKVGVPYHNSEKKLCQQYKCYINPLVTDEIVYVFADNRAVIEIKQNKEDMEEKKLNLKPFNLQKAREGKPVCTRGGRKARIVCFDRRLFYKNVSYPILALVEGSDGEDYVCGYNEKGKVLIEDGAEYKDDLMMLPEKKEGWINVYKGGKLDTDYIYPTKADAVENIFQPMKDNYIDTIKVEWEEHP